MELYKKTELVNHLKKQLIEADIKIESLKRNIDRVRQRVSYWKVKCSKLQKSSEEKELELEFNAEIEQFCLQDKITHLEQKN